MAVLEAGTDRHIASEVSYLLKAPGWIILAHNMSECCTGRHRGRTRAGSGASNICALFGVGTVTLEEAKGERATALGGIVEGSQIDSCQRRAIHRIDNSLGLVVDRQASIVASGTGDKREDQRAITGGPSSQNITRRVGDTRIRQVAGYVGV